MEQWSAVAGGIACNRSFLNQLSHRPTGRRRKKAAPMVGLTIPDAASRLCLLDERFLHARPLYLPHLLRRCAGVFFGLISRLHSGTCRPTRSSAWWVFTFQTIFNEHRWRSG